MSGDGQEAREESPVSLWFELGLLGLLWAGLIAGLVYVVRDCMKDRHVDPALPEVGDNACPTCSRLAGVDLPGGRNGSS